MENVKERFSVKSQRLKTILAVVGYNPEVEKQYTIYKNIGETPLEALERTRKERNIHKDTPMTYAGRLDPLVEGLLIILVGEECKNKDAYTGLSKTYEFEILTGMSTDTYDLLGIVTEDIFDLRYSVDVEGIQKYLEENKKSFIQKYPPYSSKTFEGKQLHAHAREGNMPILEHEVSLYDYEFLGERKIQGEVLLATILERVDLVHGDFRQEEIKQKWRQVLGDKNTQEFQITKWRVDVSAGFYIRQLVQDIGIHFKIPTVTFHIKRTKIGNDSHSS